MNERPATHRDAEDREESGADDPQPCVRTVGRIGRPIRDVHERGGIPFVTERQRRGDADRGGANGAQPAFGFRDQAASRAGSAYGCGGSRTSIARRPSDVNPGSMASRCCRLSRSRPPPATSAMASVTSTTTIAPSSRRVTRPWRPLRPPSRMTSVRLTFAMVDGRRNPDEHRRRRPSGGPRTGRRADRVAVPSTRGSAAPPITTMARTAANASGSATAVAAIAMSSDSASSGRMALQRVAPSAARTAISRARAVPRASSRLATLTIASSSRSPVAAKAMSRIGPRSPTIESRSGRITKTRFFAWSGYFFARSSHIGSSCPASAGRVRPRLEADERVEGVANRVGVVLREPEVGLARDGEAFRRDTDDQRAAAGKPNRRADDEGLAPNIVRHARCDKTTRLRSGAAIVLGGKAPAGCHRQAEELEEPFGHAEARDLPRAGLGQDGVVTPLDQRRRRQSHRWRGAARSSPPTPPDRS